MNPEERAALERLLEYVGRGFCAVQADCRMLRKYLADPSHAHIDSLISAVQRARELNGGIVPGTVTHVVRASDSSRGSRALIQGKRDPGDRPSITYHAGKASSTKKPIAKKRKR